MKEITSKTYTREDLFTIIGSVCGYGEYHNSWFLWDAEISEKETDDEGNEVQKTKILCRDENRTKRDASLELSFKKGEDVIECQFQHSEIERILREKGVIESAYEVEKIYQDCETKKFHVVMSRSIKIKRLFRDVQKTRASYGRAVALVALILVAFSPILLLIL